MNFFHNKLAKSFCLTILLLVGLPTQAKEHVDSEADSEECQTIVIFHRPNCPHCGRALDFLADLKKQHPSVTITKLDINESPEIRHRFIVLNQKLKVQRPGVPSFLICENFLVGFDTAQTTGVEIKRFLRLETGPAPPQPPHSGWVEIPWLGAIDINNMGLPLFTVTMGLIDGFNPCAMWVLLFLLSLLVHLKDRRRIVLIAGTFVLVSGVVYFAFMAAWLNLFLVVGVSRSLQISVGILAIVIGAVNVKDFFAISEGFSLTIPDSAKPGIYARVRRIINAENLAAALTGVTVLAVLVNLIELLCTAGLPAVYTQILVSHDLDTTGHYGYLLLYNVAYMIDDALMVGIVVYTLSHYKLGEKYGRWLKLVSGCVIAGLGTLLVFAPQLLF
ncbi:MAG: thioredoxin family protein [Arenicellales bacterium]|nr:thioredoxin family protein [Arenicellales bacterium]